VVTVEDHSVAGGLGGAVAEWLSEVRPTYAKFGFDPDGIARSVAKFLGR